MNNYKALNIATMAIVIVCCIQFSCTGGSGGGSTVKELTLQQRVVDRDYPSIFQAWYGIDMPEVYPVETEDQRIEACAKHDLMWEEPLSQLGEKVDLVLGLRWDGKYDGLATSFTKESLDKALKNKQKLQAKNPNMVCLMEIRWRDAPSTFLPDSSDWWKRDENDSIKKGWLGGWVPFYMLNYENPGFQDNVARQAKIACESGVYDGVMLDWSGHPEIIKKVREAIGPDKLIIVNIHDDIHHGEEYQAYINGSFMELNPIDSFSMAVPGLAPNRVNVNKRDWDNIRDALVWFEQHLMEPRINCLEVWGNRDDLQRMRATTTLGLVYSNGYQLYADPNPLKTPDHYHDWYPFWDVQLGKPLSAGVAKEDGSAWRKYENGVVVYNHYGNGEVTVSFDAEMKRASDGTTGKEFKLADRDGEIFIPIK
ncbi:MAG: hypothetical protein MI922_15695 [Bacteroidales bacterium]|nr:hypothetical protein [Bacteroidales bacterium]